jgi:transaldolase
VSASLEQEYDEAVQVMRDLQRAGIDVARVTRELLDDGIAKFVDAFNDILQTIGTKAITGSYGAARSNADARRSP